MSQADDKTKHAVIYVDGSARPNPGYTGWALHGYTYTDTESKKGSGCPTNYVTAKGFVKKKQAVDPQAQIQSPEPTVKPTEVALDQFFFEYGHIDKRSTNTVGEIAAVLQSLKFLDEHQIKSANIFCDCQSVIEGVNTYMHQWEKNGWTKANGQPPVNLEFWQELAALKNKLGQKDTQFSLKWVKAHDGDFGNERADCYASMGRMVSRQQAALENIPATPQDIKRWTQLFRPAAGFWNNNQIKTSPLITQKHCYASNTFDRPKGVYFLGNHGKDDDLFAHRKADTSTTILILKEPEAHLEKFLDFHKQAITHNTVYAINLDVIYSPLVVREVDLFGIDHYLDVTQKHNNTIVHLHDDARTPVSREYRPPLLSNTGFKELLDYYELALMYQRRDALLLYHDVTSLLYQPEKGKLKLNAELVAGVRTTDLEVAYRDKDGSQKVTKLVACLNVDIPDRNCLKKLESLEPKVTIVTWMTSDSAFRYAGVVECTQGLGLWVGNHSNLRFVPLQIQPDAA